jgi:hypothetical protein
MLVPSVAPIFQQEHEQWLHFNAKWSAGRLGGVQISSGLILLRITGRAGGHEHGDWDLAARLYLGDCRDLELPAFVSVDVEHE